MAIVIEGGINIRPGITLGGGSSTPGGLVLSLDTGYHKLLGCMVGWFQLDCIWNKDSIIT